MYTLKWLIKCSIFTVFLLIWMYRLGRVTANTNRSEGLEVTQTGYPHDFRRLKQELPKTVLCVLKAFGLLIEVISKELNIILRTYSHCRRLVLKVNICQ